MERERGDGDDKKKKKATIMKMARRACPSGPSNSGGDDLGADSFDNPNIIQNPTDKFILPGEVDRLADLDRMQFVWKFLKTFLKIIILPYFFFVFLFFSPLSYCDSSMAIGPPHTCPPQDGKLLGGGNTEGPGGPSSRDQLPSGEGRD
ncbi:hypothetical protein COCNU_scaffold007814G000010 [Cocos nucifera]|nr:hypothetical protein [Cocos nucifera]